MSRPRRLVAIAGAAVAVALLAGCSSQLQLSSASTRELGVKAVSETPAPSTPTPTPTPIPTVNPAAVCATTPAGVHHIYVNITEQTLWACTGPKLFVTTSVTTGAYALTNVHDATPVGTWRIYSKVRNTVLRGRDANGSWNDPVAYWMPFYGPYGLHDASWQKFPFGSPLYSTQGSHGCVHVPVSVLGQIFNWAPIGTLVTIHS